MELSIITVNYHHSHLLRDSLESVHLTVKEIQFEVIVVDNSFKDEGLESVLNQFPETRLIDNSTNLGFACANNQGAEVAKGDFLLFINPDTIIKEGAIEAMLEHLRSNPSVGIIGPKVLNPNGTIQYSCRKFPTIWSGLFNRYSLMTRLFPNNRYSRDYLMSDYDHSWTRSVDWVSGCCMMIPAPIFKKINGFDENYFLFIEDIDLCQAMKKEGYLVNYFPSAQIFHKISSSNARINPQTIIKRHKGMIYYYKKHNKTNCLAQWAVISLVMIRCLIQLFLNFFK